MANETKTTDIASFITQYHRRTLMPHVVHETVLTRLADTEPFPKGSGKTAELRRRLPLAVVTATTAEAADPTPVQFDGMKIIATIVALTNAVKPSRLLKDTDFKQLQDLRDLVATNMGESIEKYNINQMSPYFQHIRADGDTAYQKYFLATSAGTTTTTISTTLTEADDWWGGNSTIGYLTCTGRRNKNYGQTVKTTDWDVTGGSSENLLTHEAFPNATADGDEFWICIGTGLTTGDIITIERLFDVNFHFKRNRIKGPQWEYAFPGGSGSRYLVGASDERDLLKDSDWKDYQKRITESDLFKFSRLGIVTGHDVLSYSQEYRETVAGAASASGAIHNSLALRKHAFTRLMLTNPRIVTTMAPDSGNLLGRFFHIAWEVEYAIKVTNATAGITVLTDPTFSGAAA